MPSASSSAAGRPAAAPSIPGDAEWLLADGAGGYGSGTADGLVRRRYHALWVVRPPGGTRRVLAVAGLDERLVGADGVAVSLLHAHWRGEPGPSAPPAAVAFAGLPLPQWTWRLGDRSVARTVALARGDGDRPGRLLVRWRNLGAAPLRLVVRPLLGGNDADHLIAADDRFDGTLHARGASWGSRPTTLLPVLWLSVDGVAAFRAEPVWYRGFLYAEDRARGYDHVGDRWSPGVLELDLPAGGEATAAWALGDPCADPAAAFDAELAAATRRHAVQTADADPLRARLARTADDFLYRADGGRLGVLAGFPWFGEWGRDVFVALPGLTLARGRADLCAEALVGAVPFLRAGLLPNVYGATPAASHYDSCDAALWFALAVQRFADAGGDAALVRTQLLPALASIATAYQQGTELGLAVDGDGLLQAGRDDLNATWMDARVRGVPVTPRAGLPVEIQALWYALLAFLAEHDAAGWRQARDRCGREFVRRFWLADGAYLADRLHAGAADATVRPNMVVAAALPRSPLSRAQRAGVVSRARGELLTPRGLRTLSPLAPGYLGRYAGGVEARDAAYHQGTAWPWLGGFYVEAALAAAAPRDRRAEAVRLRQWLDGFLPELDRAGLDHVSEVFDGDEPQLPGGTFAQAWNSGELLRAIASCAEAGA